MRELTPGEPTRTCLVCDAPLTSLQRHQRVVLCGPRCRGVYSRLLPGQVCGYCGRPLKPDALAGKLCVGKDCRLKFAEKQAREKEQKEHAEREKAARLIHQRAVEPDLAGRYPLAIIPSNPVRVVPLDRRRLGFLAKHIERVLDELTIIEEREPLPPASEPETRSTELLNVLGGACSLCGGDCCRKGGERAYIDGFTINRYRRDHPDVGPREIIAAYLEKVGETVYEDSCIYHRTEGCSLPREMRSNTCNRYFCEELKAFERGASPTEPRAFFAAGGAGVVRAAGFVDEHGVRRVDVSLDGSESLAIERDDPFKFKPRA